ncbi:MAG: 16S rRNA (cytosine(1402)-N(4))-methyltransferase RsmH [Caldilineae bacterium]|nr:16S rRNA (cytosine(1402)-N(4))-methyltransferase RsmH [Chloroflexota bacterium]MCB9177715.1 16S rRNA (cytosine(1402)-N(4))-methyltransferase RsmH [Caldilineae bacterium]
MSAPSATTRHVPVLLAEVLTALAPRAGGRYLDTTFGGGGHAAAILDASGPDGRLLGLDRDPAAIERGTRHLAAYGERLALSRTSFDQLDEAARSAGFDAFDGVLFDLGYSSDQLDDPARGLSFRSDGPLDMRLDPDLTEAASDLVNGLAEDALANLIYRFGEEPASRRIARAIVQARPVAGTAQLAELIAAAIGFRPQRGRRAIHPATRTFQALRIAVNDELGALDRGLDKALALLAPGGRIAVISFHSLEDRIVKRRFQDWARACSCPPELPICACSGQARLRLLGRKPTEPGDAELQLNPRARSARLRAAERLQPGA